MSPVVVREQPLRQFVGGVCLAMGAPPEVADEVAVHLVRANLSGHDSHGVVRLPGYVAEAEAGTLVPGARARVLRETAVTALVDAGRGFGHHSTAVALAWCLERARASGLAAAAVRHSSHVGRVGEYGERAAEAGLLAIVTVGAAGPGVGEVMLFGGRDRYFGANPWSFAAPGRRRSMVFDGPTSAVSESDVRLARAKGEPLPPDCIYDRYGRPATDPDDFFAGGALVPLGGAVAGHRGSGLAFASALLGGLAMIGDEGPSLVGAPSERAEAGQRGRVAGVFVQVIDPAAFGDPDAYRDMVEGTLAAAKSARPGAGRSEVLLPGEPEARARAERARTGVRLPDVTWADLAAVAHRFGVPLPEHTGP
jgi:hydroxycarboxylate dehydrogenase B